MSNSLKCCVCKYLITLSVVFAKTMRSFEAPYHVLPELRIPVITFEYFRLNLNELKKYPCILLLLILARPREHRDHPGPSDHPLWAVPCTDVPKPSIFQQQNWYICKIFLLKVINVCFLYFAWVLNKVQKLIVVLRGQPLGTATAYRGQPIGPMSGRRPR